jgi:recombinational DNA repair protein RecR
MLTPELPPVSVLDFSPDIEVQTRAVLSLLIERTQSGEPAKRASIEPATCPNCGEIVENSRSPYCSDECREMSAFVRQFRSAVADNKIQDLERQAALGQKLWHVLGGGYPRRDVLVPNKVRVKVIEREGNKCQQCGAKATTIDHSGSG